MLILKQRRIVKELYNFIWKEEHDHGLINWEYKDAGIYSKTLIDWLFQKKVLLPSKNKLGNFLLSIKKQLQKHYIRDFYDRNKELIKDCVKDGYINLNGTLLTVSPKGKRFISLEHNIWDILKHPLILKLVEIGIPAWVVREIVLAFIERNR